MPVEPFAIYIIVRNSKDGFDGAFVVGFKKITVNRLKLVLTGGNNFIACIEASSPLGSAGIDLCIQIYFGQDSVSCPFVETAICSNIICIT